MYIWKWYPREMWNVRNEKCGLFSLDKCGLYFQYDFGSSWSTAVVSDRIAMAFNRSEATRALAFDISKALDGVWHAGLFHKFKSYRISGQSFGLISSFFQ